MITIDELVAALMRAREESPIGGDTVIHLCRDEEEYHPIQRMMLDTCGDGAVFLLSDEPGEDDRPPVWVNKKPEVDGYYWVIYPGHRRPVLVQVVLRMEYRRKTQAMVIGYWWKDRLADISDDALWSPRVLEFERPPSKACTSSSQRARGAGNRPGGMGP